MQTARPPAQRLVAGGGSGNHGTTAQEAVAAAALAAAGEVVGPQCRICWLEADGLEAGVLLSPCHCSGSSRYVHRRCLAAWMDAVAQRKGVHLARHCDVCRAPYHVPRDMQLRESPQEFLQRQAKAALASPAGIAASYYAAAGMVFATVWAAHGAWHSVTRVQTVVRAAQQRPLQSLRLVMPDLLLSVVSEAIISGHWTLPLVSAGRYAQGLMLHLAASWAQERAAGVLPAQLLPLALGACRTGRLAAAAVQYAHMSLLLVFGGLAKGFVRGSLIAAMAPIHLVACAGGALRQGAAAVLGLLLRVRTLRQRKRSSKGRRRQQLQQQQLQRGGTAEQAGLGMGAMAV